jgi:hypothetical protein
LSCAREVVAIRRILARQDPDIHLPALADSLSNLAHRLAGLGREQEAASQYDEAAKIRGQLT